MKTVIIEVKGGIIQHITSPSGIQFTIVDKDNDTVETYDADTTID